MASVILVSFPDVVGALSPAVAAAFVDAVSAFWKIEKSPFAHKNLDMNRMAEDFSLSREDVVSVLLFH
jgi:hypothetical protein